MANGFFLGGLARGAQEQQKIQQGSRGLDLTERQIANKEALDKRSLAKSTFENGIKSLTGLVGLRNSPSAGKSVPQLDGAIADLSKKLLTITGQAGIDDTIARSQILGAINQPTSQELAIQEANAKASGAVSAARLVASQTGVAEGQALEGAGLVPAAPSFIKLQRQRDELLAAATVADQGGDQAQAQILRRNAEEITGRLAQQQQENVAPGAGIVSKAASIDKIIQDTRTAKLNFRNASSALSTLNDLAGEIKETPEGFDIAGKTLNQFVRVKQNLFAIGTALGKDTTRFENGESITTENLNERADRILAGASLSVRLKSVYIQTALTIAAAKGFGSGRELSDKDFDFALESLGQAAGNPKIIQEVIKQQFADLVQNANNTIRTNNEFLPPDRQVPDFDLASEFPELAGGPIDTGATNVVRGPDGKLVIQ